IANGRQLPTCREAVGGTQLQHAPGAPEIRQRERLTSLVVGGLDWCAERASAIRAAHETTGEAKLRGIPAEHAVAQRAHRAGLHEARQQTKYAVEQARHSRAPRAVGDEEIEAGVEAARATGLIVTAAAAIHVTRGEREV